MINKSESRHRQGFLAIFLKRLVTCRSHGNYIRTKYIKVYKYVNKSNYQEIVVAERKSHSKNRGGKKTK